VSLDSFPLCAGLALSGHRREADEHVVETGEVIKIGVE
jgi:hypothetical protein